MKAIPLLSIICCFLSCTTRQSILGKWESTHLITKVGGQTISLNVSKEDFRYSTWEFNNDGSLSMLTGRDKSHYSLQNDTIRITAHNGTISVVPVIKLSGNELRIRDLLGGDSVVRIFRRIK
jgi:hypothetical protein